MIDPLTRELADAFVAAGYHAIALDPVPPSNTGIVEVYDPAGSAVVARLYPNRDTGLWHSINVVTGNESFTGFFDLRSFDQVVFHVSMMYPETVP